MIQYSHNRKDSHGIDATLAIDVPTKEFLTHFFLTHSNKSMFLAGIAIKGKKDSFERKKGREAAEKRMIPLVFDLDMITQEGTRHIYDFYTNQAKVANKTYHVRIRLTTVAESTKVKLIGSHIDLAHNEITYV